MKEQELSNLVYKHKIHGSCWGDDEFSQSFDYDASFKKNFQ